VDKNRSGLPTTSAAVLRQLFAQTCKRQPTCLRTRSRADIADSKWIACTCLRRCTDVDVLLSPT